MGHGGVPSDCPRDLVTKLKALEGRRRAQGGGEPSAEERDLDARIREWPRTPETDPYRAGIEALAASLRPMLGGATLFVAYNEFCAPTVEEAVASAIEQGATSITVVPSMLTPGGVHSEVEIPEAIERLRARYRDVGIAYAWPFDMSAIAGMLAAQVARFQTG